MSKHNITLIPGDGIGPEIIAATVRIIEATGVEIAEEGLRMMEAIARSARSRSWQPVPSQG